MEEKKFTPALGYPSLTPLYDFAIAALTREQVWRNKVIEHLDPGPCDRILDVGCGTGSLIVQIKRLALLAEVIGLDPDGDVLNVARNKIDKSHLEIDIIEGFLDASTVGVLPPVNKIVSSLVFHQTPLQEKLNILKQMHSLLKPGGQVVIADYGLQRTRLMRTLFRASVQQIDGVSDTQPNADGVLPDLLNESGFLEIEEVDVIPTLTGSISIYTGGKPEM